MQNLNEPPRFFTNTTRLAHGLFDACMTSSCILLSCTAISSRAANGTHCVACLIEVAPLVFMLSLPDWSLLFLLQQLKICDDTPLGWQVVCPLLPKTIPWRIRRTFHLFPYFLLPPVNVLI